MAVEKKVEITTEQLLDLVAKSNAALTAMVERQPHRQIQEGDPEYQERLKAEGLRDEFEHKVFQNGYEAQARGYSEQTRHRASHLRAGHYINDKRQPGKKRVTVEVHGQDVYIKYPNSHDGRIENMSYWKDFPDLIDQIWDEMTAVPA